MCAIVTIHKANGWNIRIISNHIGIVGFRWNLYSTGWGQRTDGGEWNSPIGNNLVWIQLESLRGSDDWFH